MCVAILLVLYICTFYIQHIFSYVYVVVTCFFFVFVFLALNAAWLAADAACASTELLMLRLFCTVLCTLLYA